MWQYHDKNRAFNKKMNNNSYTHMYPGNIRFNFFNRFIDLYRGFTDKEGKTVKKSK